MRLRTHYIKSLFISYSKLRVNIWLAMMFYLHYKLLWYITWNLHDDDKNILFFWWKFKPLLQSDLENGGGGGGCCWAEPGGGALPITLPFRYLRCSSQEKQQRNHENKHIQKLKIKKLKAEKYKSKANRNQTDQEREAFFRRKCPPLPRVILILKIGYTAYFCFCCCLFYCYS